VLRSGGSGYDLYRQITAGGVTCQVIAPALTPRRPGQRIKTDRRDARKLVGLFRAGELTPIHVPDEAEEAVRDLVRCREAVRRDVVRWRHRLLKLLDRHGRLWVVEKNWTQRHWTWIRAQHFELAALPRAFEATVFALEQALARQAELDKEIEALAATVPYRDPVGWLRGFRGLGTLSAMVLLAEIVDFQRFRRPRELMAYLGLVPSEYSSGETQRRGALTKAGNTHARRVLVEAAWPYRHRPMVGHALASRSQGQPAAVVGQAWRAQQRLHRRYRHLVGHGKRPPVAVAAIARELVGFPVGGHDKTGNAPARRLNPARTSERGSGLDFLSGVGTGAMRTRLESPRVCYATPDLPIGTTRASRQRQLPTNQCHAALPSPVIRAYQPDSSSKPSHRQPDADALGKSSTPRNFRGCRCRSRDRCRLNKPLDGRSFHISREPRAELAVEEVGPTGLGDQCDRRARSRNGYTSRYCSSGTLIFSA
jgi:transposase